MNRDRSKCGYWRMPSLQKGKEHIPQMPMDNLMLLLLLVYAINHALKRSRVNSVKATILYVSLHERNARNERNVCWWRIYIVLSVKASSRPTRHVDIFNEFKWKWLSCCGKKVKILLQDICQLLDKTRLPSG